MSQPHPTFTLLRSETIESLQVTVEEYEHKVTGAQHIHINADNNENVFLVALRTVPHDSTGVAHILEHTALCGSRKYPVRDPFFMMIRRSLNTFMNAFTSSDWTAYPFASQNRKDFNNLLDVYLDAVFFSRLDPLDFAQEGHRVDFAEAGNPESDLVYKGVVFNEMKGAMSSVPSQLWQTLCKYLYPTTTYHYNSGGEPEDIPDLSYEELVDFYKTHYHPSNAIFMTYGDISAAEHQQAFEEKALNEFERLDQTIEVGLEKRYLSPVTVEEHYPASAEESPKSHVVLGWLFGKSTDLESSLQAQLVSQILLDNSSSPLLHALETTDLGDAPSPLIGLEDSQHELTFICGLEGCDAEHATQIESLILDVLKDVSENGVDQEILEAALQQLELQQREVGGDSYPYGLQIILTALTSSTHRGDPIGLLNLDPALEKLKADIKDPNFIKDLVKTLLLENQHRVRLTLKPDTELSQRKVAAEAKRLADIKSGMSDTDKQNVIDLAEALEKRQLQIDDDSILPKVGLEDIPVAMHYTPVENQVDLPERLTRYSAGTNGLVYQQIIVEIPKLTEDQLNLLSYYGILLTEVGVGEKDYLEVQQWQAAVAGSISAFSNIRGEKDNEQRVGANLTLSAKALKDCQPALTELMWETLQNARFNEPSRIKEILTQVKARREQSVTGNGHMLAMMAASSGLSPSANLSHELNGLEGIRAVKSLVKDLDDEQKLNQFMVDLNELHSIICAAPKQYLLVGENEHLDSYQSSLEQTWKDSTDKAVSAPPFSLEAVNEHRNQAWITNTQVNFCAKSYKTVPSAHPDAAALTVTAGLMRNGFLHRVIREQGGAYGGGANQDSNIGAFRFYSYRDPRFTETLSDFDQSIQWVIETDHEWQSIEEAILGVISGLDKPSSPAGEAKQTFHAELFGRDRDSRETFRKQVLQVSQDDIKRVAKIYLLDKPHSTAVVTNSNAVEQAKSLSLGIEQL